MLRLREPLVTLVLLLGLSACDERAASTTPSGQQSPGFGQLQLLEMEQLQANLRETPGDFQALSRLGDMYFESGQYQQAIQMYDRALLIDPGCADCLNDRGLAQFYLNNPEDALASLEAANEADPDYPNAWLSKAYVLVSIGRYEEALEPLQQVKRTDTSGVLARDTENFLAMIEAHRASTQ